MLQNVEVLACSCVEGIGKSICLCIARAGVAAPSGSLAPLRSIACCIAWMEIRRTFSVPMVRQISLTPLQRSRREISSNSGTMTCADRVREVGEVRELREGSELIAQHRRCAISRLKLYSRNEPSGLRFPAVLLPWPGSIRIVIMLQF